MNNKGEAITTIVSIVAILTLCTAAAIDGQKAAEREAALRAKNQVSEDFVE